MFAEEKDPLALCSCGLSFPVVTWFTQYSCSLGFPSFPGVAGHTADCDKAPLILNISHFFYSSLNFARQVNKGISQTHEHMNCDVIQSVRYLKCCVVFTRHDL